MCGIVGILGREPVAGALVDALKRLEYRGYDSAGVATLEDGHLARRRAEGKLRNLESKLAREPLAGTIGIGHTRWATHGGPTENNAHPHATDRLAVVHNGIIENFQELREELLKKGVKFGTETDTEVVAHLVTQEMKNGRSPSRRCGAALPRLRGAFALAFLFAGEDDLLIGARKGSPLAVGYGDGEMYLGSDAIALAPFTDTISLSRGRRLGRADAQGRRGARRRRQHGRARDASSRTRRRSWSTRATIAISWRRKSTSSPRSSATRWRTIIDFADGADAAAGRAAVRFRASSSACRCRPAAPPTMPAWSAKYWFERFARLPVEIDIASEFRYREAPLQPGGLAIFVSQSGETADTLATLRYAKEQKQHVLSVVNVPTSTIARESDVVMPTLAGPEIGVASTKAFTCQLAVLACLAVAAGRARGVLSEDDEKQAGARADRGAAADGGGAEARTADRAAGARSEREPQRALSRPRHQLSAGARGRAQAQGNLLHPRRGLRRRRAQARADRADRQDHAGDRDRAARPGVREDRVQHAGGRGARRADHPDHRPGRARARPTSSR